MTNDTSEQARPSTRFIRYELRTTDVAAARAFYEPLLEQRAPDITVLSAQSLERGNAAHWLGYLGVDDVPLTADAFVARGAMRSGPPADQSASRTVLRDPGGAGLALAPIDVPARSDVIWHQLLTRDLGHATDDYCSLFGWRLTEMVDLGLFGRHQQFSWNDAGKSVGSIADSTSLPGVHTSWLFYFRVADLTRAVDAVRASGGLVTGPTTLPSGVRIAICDDPQGAAFGLMESSAS